MTKSGSKAGAKHKNPEVASPESVDPFRVQADDVPVLIWGMGPDGCNFVNRAYREFLGVSGQADVGRFDWAQYVHPDDREAYVNKYLDCFSRRATFSAVFRFRRHDGVYRWMKSVGRPRFDPAGVYQGYVGSTQDITEQKAMEDELRIARDTLVKTVEQQTAELRESKERYRALVETSADAIIVHKDGRFLYANQAALRLHGVDTLEQLQCRTVLDTIHSDDRESVAARMEQMAKGAIAPLKGGRLVRPDGHVVYFESTGTQINYGGEIAFQVIVRDITERKRAEVELARINRAVKAISRCNEVVIHARDEQSLLEDICNIVVEDGGYRMAWIGFRADDSDKSVRPVAKTGVDDGYVEKARVTWADTERGRGPTGTALRTGKPSVVRNVFMDPNFRPWREDAIRMGYASVLGLPLIADNRSFGVLTIYSARPDAFDAEEFELLQDLADNLAFGIASLRSRNEQERAEKALAEAKSRAELYLDLMGHDINNINQIALGYLEMAMGLPTEARDDELLRKPVEALQRSAELIKNVRKLQREQSGGYTQEIYDLGELIEGVAAQYRKNPDKYVRITIGSVKGIRVQADELLKDVFANLIGNAIKHTEGPTHIMIMMGVARGDRFCRVMIDDNGPGIPDDRKKKLFERLGPGDSKTSGIGLGLYLVKTLVESYKGHVWVEDRVKGDHTKGARFVVMLPTVEQ